MKNNGSEQKKAIEAWMSEGFEKISLGGGGKNLQGFVNIDFVRHVKVEREIIANVLDLSFIPSESLSHVHSNHVIEHFREEDIVLLLKQSYRVLRPGGVISIRCPNALGVTYGFWFPPILEADRQRFIDVGFPADEDFGSSVDGWFHKDFYGLLHWIFGDVGNIENQHLSIITPTKLTSWLNWAGFKVLTVSAPEATNLVVVGKKI